MLPVHLETHSTGVNGDGDWANFSETYLQLFLAALGNVMEAGDIDNSLLRIEFASTIL